MKTEDIERLKEICEREGFEVTRSREGSILFHIKKKDPWDGVEYARFLLKDSQTVCYTNGKIYPVKECSKSELFTKYDDLGSTDNGHFFRFWEPSTESEYVNQLQNQATERFGDFREREIDYSDLKIHPIANKIGFVYNKIHDSLHWCGVPVYCAGNWAKVVERVTVTESELTGEAFWNVFKFRVKNSHMVKKSGEEIKQFLIEQLEKYLNV